MQISSTSYTSFSGRKGFGARAGFTLVELLISIAIIGIVTSIVLVKYGAFDSTVLLKGLAYEIALTLREAQVRSVSVARDASMGDSSTNFDYPFGVTFSIANPKQYTFFRYKHATDYPVYDVPDPDPDAAEDIRTFVISRTMQIMDLCVTDASGETCGIDRLDVSFRRPKFKGLFYAVDGANIFDTNVTSATIKVGSQTSNLQQFEVVITSLGQIMVQKP